MKKFSAVIIIASLMLSACARNMATNTYKSSEGSGKVVEGTIVSARQVELKEADKLGDNAVGGLAGGVAGGVAGSAIGKGKGEAAATVGGVIAGALIGAVIQDQLGKSDGMEYIIKIAGNNQAEDDKDSNKTRIVHQNKDEVKDSISTNMKTNLISVTQGVDEIFKKGDHVYVIYTDGRARVISAN